jgi:hypothetical protein
MTETNRYGQPLKTVTLEEVMEDLRTLPVGIVMALCASLIVVYLSKRWKEIFKSITKNDPMTND